MKKFFMPLLLLGIVFSSCSKDDEITEVEEVEVVEEETALEKKKLEINDFIWKSMNNIYLYKAQIPQLGDDYFSTQAELNEYLSKWDDPEDLFYNGLVYDNLDKFSWIVDDYSELESYLAGSSKSAGFRYGFAYAPNSDTKVVAYVIYVSPEGPADLAGLKRGEYISHVNGSEMTVNNYTTIFNPEVLELGRSKVENGALVSNGDPITVTKAVFKEQPIAVDKVFTVDGVKIGYLYLSTFLGEFGIDDVKLNDVFGKFKSENIDELIVDLRYNSGGYSEFSADLASMVTGQFEGQILTQQLWNDNWMDYWKKNDPEAIYNRFDAEVSTEQAINSLYLERIYVIETDRSYSASESFLIALEPYIDVIHVGQNTGGKFQGSVTIYDSEGFFTKEGINTSHKYAIQPLIYKYANATGYTDFVGGLTPDIEKEESISNLGQLGELDEPLLARTIQAITGVAPQSSAVKKQATDTGLNFRKLAKQDEKGWFISRGDALKELPLSFPEN